MTISIHDRSSTPIPGEIIAIGSELLIGNRVETNSLFLADRLAQLGVETKWKTCVGDDPRDLAGVLRQAIRRAKIVITTGGLGSTVDDCTRRVIADVTKRPLRRRQKALRHLQDRFRSRGRRLTAALSCQAAIPAGAEVIENPNGTAVGFWLEWKRALIIVLPGVFQEARLMFEGQVIRTLQSRIRSSRVMHRRSFHSFGLTEAAVDARLDPIIRAIPEVQFSLLASPRGVSVLLRYWGRKTHPGAPESMRDSSWPLEQAARDVRRRLGRYIYAEGDQELEEVVGRQLGSRGFSLAVAESCTGGLVGHRLTQVSGSSAYFDRSVVCYSNQAKHQLLGISHSLLRRHGAVSAPVAGAMASGVRRRSGTTLGLGITGIAGPGGGSKDKPVGLVYIGIDGPKGLETRQFHFSGEREAVKFRASQAALDILRRYVGNE